ncbi:MAG: hypothetical protein BGO12_20325 [Verrucomicrobia bacterium 61-8]|nr:hypothetical protein [Verrucomicrobiota bacterium]OJV03444.1 MAG: hypothetical protein BGO12_20325 [Verrucomicrobia bacterium 61-8]
MSLSPQPRHFPLRLIAGGLGLLALFAVAVVVVRTGDPGPAPEDAARVQERRTALVELHKKDAERLNTYAVVDRTTDSFQIPIARAMELVVREYASTSPRAVVSEVIPAATPEATPPPTPSAAP